MISLRSHDFIHFSPLFPPKSCKLCKQHWCDEDKLCSWNELFNAGIGSHRGTKVEVQQWKKSQGQERPQVLPSHCLCDYLLIEKKKKKNGKNKSRIRSTHSLPQAVYIHLSYAVWRRGCFPSVFGAQLSCQTAASGCHQCCQAHADLKPLPLLENSDVTGFRNAIYSLLNSWDKMKEMLVSLERLFFHTSPDFPLSSRFFLNSWYLLRICLLMRSCCPLRERQSNSAFILSISGSPEEVMVDTEKIGGCAKVAAPPTQKFKSDA